MSQNIGTLITSAIRPNDSQDPIAVAFANEVKGGHHIYATLAERNVIIESRRDWGMLATIYNDATASNNKTYQLSFSYSSNSILDNGNWIAFSSGAVTTGGEWLNSVITKTSSIPLSNNDKDRYLIIGTPSGTQSVTPNTTWSGYVDAVAEYSSVISSWNFTFPTEGTTLRVDDDINTLYKYTGIYGSGGSWVVENINQVFFITATSSNGYDYTAYANITSYSKPAVFYTSFATASIGPSASLKINNLSKIPIRKVTGNALDNIAAGDLNTTVEYQLIYDGTYFQTPILSAVNQIGPAENGSSTYTSGLYTDFISTTQIGTPIDRFNQILKSLVPPSAPTLRSWNGTLSSSAISNAGVGKLSFPNDYAVDYNQATASPYGNVFLNETWGYGATADGGLYRLGIISNNPLNFNVDLLGTLNYNVATQSSTPVPAYVRGAFGNGNKGYLIMNINGLTVSTLSLTYSLIATNSTVGYTKPGFSVSTATSSKFPVGDAFDIFYNRTGNWYLPKSCLSGPFSYTSSIGLTANQFGVTKGYNSITINHNINGVDNKLNRIEFVLDDNTPTPSYTNAAGSGQFASVTTNATKTISGITYITNITLIYNVNISDMYKYAYYSGTDAIQWNEDYTQGTSLPTNTSIIPSANLSNNSLPSITTTYNLNSAYTVTKTINISTTSAANKRRIGDPIKAYLSRLIAPTTSIGYSGVYSEYAQLSNVVLDTFGINSTYNAFSQLEPFDDEARRLQTGGSYDTIISLSNLFSSSTNLQTDLGLQVYNGRLYYPTLNWSNIGTGVSNPNYGISTTNYFSCAGTRTYFRLFYLDTATWTSKTFVLNLQGSTTVVRMSATPTNSQIQISVKLPTKTAWCDALLPYSTDSALLSDGGGCFAGAPVTSLAITNTNINLNFGGYGTSNSQGYVVVRITAPANWNGYLDSMQLTYN